MSTITMDIPDDLVERLKPVEDQLPQILALGLREWYAASQLDLTGAAEVLEFLAELPAPAEILALRPSAEMQVRVTELLDKNRTVGLTTAEAREWEQYEYLEHLVRVAKAKAYARLYPS